MNGEKRKKTNKDLKEALKNEVAPLLIGLRNEQKDTNKAIETLARKIVESGQIPIGTPEEIKEMNSLLKEILQESKKKDSQDWTFEVSKELIKKIKGERGLRGFKGADGKNGKTPKKGVDYFTKEEIKYFLDKATPIKGIHYRDGEDGITTIKTVTVEITATQVRNKLESLKGSQRLSISAIKGLSERLDSMGGGGGIGGSGTVTGASAFIQLTDAPSSYSGAGGKGVRVNAGATGLEFYTIAGDTDEKVSVQSDDTAGYLSGKLVAGSNITISVTGIAGARTLTIAGSAGYTDEQAQDAVGVMIDSSLTYVDATPLLKVNEAYAHTWTGRAIFSVATPTFVSDLSTLGSEKVSNGTFTGSASGWTLASGWAYASNAVSHTSNGTGTLSQNANALNGEFYVLTYTISAWTVGTVTPSCGGFTGTAVGANGTYTEYFLATSTASLTFTPTNTARFTIDTISLKKMSAGDFYVAGNSYSGVSIISVTASNSSPGTTRHLSFKNPSGNYTWLDFYFGSTLKGAIEVNSSGGVNIYSSGSNYVGFYTIASGLYSYNSPSGFYSGGYGQFQNYVSAVNGVNAGASGLPTSTLQSQGSTALKVVRITTSRALANTETHILADATNAAACAGTASVACSTYTNSTDCNARDAHGGCTWNTYNCSDYNGTDSGTCTSGHSGCTWDSASCAGPTDQSSCESQDDAYGGSCVWNICSSFMDSGSCGSGGCSWNCSNCSDFNGNQGGCEGTSGCTWDTANCNNYDDNYAGCIGQGGCSWSGGGYDCSLSDATDQATCEANAGCVWNGGANECQGTCSGTYALGTCSGQYNCACSGTDNCSGSYNTGTCSGTWGNCTGTSSCAGIDDETNCNNETGCSWSTILNLTLPLISSVPDRVYFIKNDSSGGQDIVLYPASGDDIDGASTYTISGYKDSIHIAPFRVPTDCSGLGSQGACEAQSGCTWNVSQCSDFNNTDEATCETGHSGCTWNDPNCEGTYGGNCSGTYYPTRRWHVFGERNFTEMRGYISKNSSYTLTDGDRTIELQGGTYTITLPTAVGRAGKRFTFKRTSSTGTATINTTSSQTIYTTSAVTSLTPANGAVVIVESNGSNWIQIN